MKTEISTHFFLH